MVMVLPEFQIPMFFFFVSGDDMKEMYSIYAVFSDVCCRRYPQISCCN